MGLPWGHLLFRNFIIQTQNVASWEAIHTFFIHELLTVSTPHPQPQSQENTLGRFSTASYTQIG